MSVDEEIRALAAQQHSLITGDQLKALGLGRSALRHRLKIGVLQRIAARLFCIGGAPITNELRLRAALLECGGHCAIAKDSAAAHWAFPGFRLVPAHVLRLRDGTYPPVRFARLHTTTRLTDAHVVSTNGLFVTTPARTLFDLAGDLHPARLELLLDRAWSRRLVNWQVMNRTFRDLQSRGRPGIAVMRALLEDRPSTYVPPESNLEARFQRLLRDDLQQEMDRQVNVGNDESWLGRIDFIDREKKVVVEIQSDVHHSSVSDVRADAIRHERMTLAGWIIRPIAEWDIWYRPTVVQATVRKARRNR